MAADSYKLVVVHPATRTWFEPRDVRGDLEYPGEFRDALIAVASTSSYLTPGSPSDWIGDFEGRLYTEREHRKGAYEGGWAEPERIVRYEHAWG